VDVCFSTQGSFEPKSGHVNVSSYDISTGWFQDADSKAIKLVSQSSLNNYVQTNLAGALVLYKQKKEK
jgi:hypothetical protein